MILMTLPTFNIADPDGYGDGDEVKVGDFWGHEW